MRTDPQIFVLCDLCGAEDVWEPNFSYPDYSGKNGSYDTSDAEFLKWVDQNNWSQDANKDLCPDCTEQHASHQSG